MDLYDRVRDRTVSPTVENGPSRQWRFYRWTSGRVPFVTRDTGDGSPDQTVTRRTARLPNGFIARLFS